MDTQAHFLPRVRSWLRKGSGSGSHFTGFPASKVTHQPWPGSRCHS